VAAGLPTLSRNVGLSDSNRSDSRCSTPRATCTSILLSGHVQDSPVLGHLLTPGRGGAKLAYHPREEWP